MAAQSRLGEATGYYTEALRWWPRNAQAHNNLGNALRRQGQIEDAIPHYTEALRLKPTFAEAHNNLGAALLDWQDPTVGDLVAAVGAADLVVVASPTYKGTYTGRLKLSSTGSPRPG